jgi:competence protein CoiA
MLTAMCDGARVEAAEALRGLNYCCPGCSKTVILKKGRIKIAHFAHKPPADCLLAAGETLAHLRQAMDG